MRLTTYSDTLITKSRKATAETQQAHARASKPKAGQDTKISGLGFRALGFRA